MVEVSGSIPLPATILDDFYKIAPNSINMTDVKIWIVKKTKIIHISSKKLFSNSKILILY